MHSEPSRRTTGNLRCRLCGRTLVSQSSEIVPHKPGPGQVAFEPRKRDPRWAVVPPKMPAPPSSSASSGPGAAVDGERAAPSSASGQSTVSDSATVQSQAGGPSSVSDDTESKASQAGGTASGQAQPSSPQIQTAASLASRLPPHLAALRLGRAAPPPPPPPTQAAAAACSSHFIEPQPWMASFLDGGEVRGRIQCPNGRCSGKLGNWDWAGAQCACGAWVTPAFALHASRVDAV
ncbi:hypothetical protein V8E36_001173 [Tilletia maclaganii]